MNFKDLASIRQSDRKIDSSREVERWKIEQILETARLAPSACNSQPWRFVVITDKEKVAEVGKACATLTMNRFAVDAPIHILVVEEKANFTAKIGGFIKDKEFPLIDIGIVISYITLQAADLGLGSCILGWFDEKKVRSVAGIPRNKRVLADIVIGYSLAEQRKKIRKSLDEICRWESYE